MRVRAHFPGSEGYKIRSSLRRKGSRSLRDKVVDITRDGGLRSLE